MAFSKFWSDDFDKKGCVRGLAALQFFWLLKKATRTFNFIYGAFLWHLVLTVNLEEIEKMKYF